MSARRFLVAALPLLLAGCGLGPFYQRPKLEIPEAFRATPATAEAAWPEPGWWRGFGSPELDGLIAEARRNSPDLAAAAARVVQADAQSRVSGAPLLPSVDAVASDRYQRIGLQGSRRGGTTFATGGFTGTGAGTSGTGATGAPIDTGTTVVSTGGGNRYVDSRNYSGELQVSYDVDFWGRNRALAEASDLSFLASRFDQETVALNVVSSVATTYFQALAFGDRVAVAERNLRFAEDILAAIRGRFEAGTANALDVAQQETQVAGIRAGIPALRSQRDQQVIALGILVGHPPSAVGIRAASLDKVQAPLVGPGLPSALLARRPDVANAEAQLRAENANVRAARAAFFPQVALTASGGLQSVALSSILGPGTVIAALAGTVTQTIFDNGSKRGQLDQARGRYDELAADYRKAVLQAFTDVENALTALRFATEQEKLERDAVAVAQRAADIARAQLREGTIDVVTALQAQNALLTDQDQLAQVRLTRFQALVNLYKALGGGWTSPGAGA